MDHGDVRQPGGDVRSDEAPERDLADVIAPLRALGERIDRQRYPGEAWPAARPRRRRPALRVATAAAAAVVLIALGAAVWWHYRHRPIDEPPPVQVATAPAEKPNEPTALPGLVDPAYVSRVRWTVPRIPMPSTVDDNGTHVRWTIPRIRFPSFTTAPARQKPKTTSQPRST